MEIKIDINVNLSNFNQIIDKFMQITNKTNYIQQKEDSQENIIKNEIKSIEHIRTIKEENFDEKIDLIKIREKIGQLTNSGNLLQVQNLLKKYNAKKVSEVKVENYENLYTDIIKLIN